MRGCAGEFGNAVRRGSIASTYIGLDWFEHKSGELGTPRPGKECQQCSFCWPFSNQSFSQERTFCRKAEY